MNTFHLKNINIKEELERSEQICNKWFSDEEKKILREEPINKADDALVALKLSLINTKTIKG